MQSFTLKMNANILILYPLGYAVWSQGNGKTAGKCGLKKDIPIDRGSSHSLHSNFTE